MHISMAEIAFFEGCSAPTPTRTKVLLSRFMDNRYIGYVNFPSPATCEHAILFTQVFHDEFLTLIRQLTHGTLVEFDACLM